MFQNSYALYLQTHSGGGFILDVGCVGGSPFKGQSFEDRFSSFVKFKEAELVFEQLTENKLNFRNFSGGRFDIPDVADYLNLFDNPNPPYTKFSNITFRVALVIMDYTESEGGEPNLIMLRCRDVTVNRPYVQSKDILTKQRI